MHDKIPLFKYDDNYGNLFGEGLFNQYKIILGDFGSMGFERPSDGHGDDGTWIDFENWLVLLYFLGATFFTQIVIMNMLIAIMGSTYDRHNEDLHANATRQKLVLQAEFVKLVGAYQKYLLCCCSKKAGKKSIQEAESGTTGYLFVIQPSLNSEDDDVGENRSDPGVTMLHKVVE